MLLRSARDEAAIYEFDLSSGKWSLNEPGREEPTGIRGFADVRQIGVRNKEEVFAAIFSLDGMLHVAIPPQHFIWPGQYKARRTSLLSRIKSFAVKSSARTFLQFYYVFVDSAHGFPGPEAVDIFKMIAWKTATAADIRETIYLWDAVAEGEDVTTHDFQQRLDRVRNHANISALT